MLGTSLVLLSSLWCGNVSVGEVPCDQGPAACRDVRCVLVCRHMHLFNNKLTNSIPATLSGMTALQ
jgi:hypothetical protein